MDFEMVSPEDFGRSLSGLGFNIIVQDVVSLASFLTDVFEMKAHRLSADFAIMVYGKQVFQLHSDGTYHSHPLLSLLPENRLRGAGIEIRLYNSDPDDAAESASSHVHQSVILQVPTNKSHGLRECVILCENGYAWIPSRYLSDEEVKAVG